MEESSPVCATGTTPQHVGSNLHRVDDDVLASGQAPRNVSANVQMADNAELEPKRQETSVIKKRLTGACANIKTFTALACLCLLTNSIIFTTQISTITTVQKAFGLSSLDIGTWFMAYTVGEVVSGIVVSYFTGQSRIPQVLALSMCITALSCFAHVSPHFVFGRYGNVIEVDSQVSNKGYVQGVCTSNQSSLRANANWSYIDGSSTIECPPANADSEAVLIIYIVAGVLLGIGYAPIPILSLVYIDANAGSKENAAFYQGLHFGVYYFAYLVGYIVAALTLTVYVDLTNVTFTLDDPRWIGAWWLGYAICGIANALLAVVVFFFPARLPKLEGDSTVALDAAAAIKSFSEENNENKPSEDLAVDDYKDELPSPKLFFPTLWSFMTNPIYVFATLTLCTTAWIDSGFLAYLPKYLEVQFHQSAPAADLETGLTTSLVSTFTVMAGSWVVSRFKLNVKQCAGMLMVTYLLASLLYVAAMFFYCPQDVAFANKTHHASYDCMDREFYPVCMNETTYFSPCHAGCQTMTADEDKALVFTDCLCSATHVLEATTGVCTADCNSVVPYLVTSVLAYALTCFAQLAGLTILLRCVLPHQRSFSLGIYYECLSLIGGLPSPLVYGTIIDATCLTWDRVASCDVGGSEGDRGNCVQYDNPRFRINMHSLTFGLQMVGAVLASCTWLVIQVKEKMNHRPASSEVNEGATHSIADNLHPPEYSTTSESQTRL